MSIFINFDTEHGICWCSNSHNVAPQVAQQNVSIVAHTREHGIHCLPCSYTNDIIDQLP